jgi:hypothetical protein
MIAHLDGLYADQGFPIPGDDYDNNNDIDFYDDQSATFDCDIDRTINESHSSKMQDEYVRFSSPSDSSPESVIVSSESSPSRVEVGLWNNRTFHTVVSPRCDMLSDVPETVPNPIDKLVQMNSDIPVRKKCTIKKGDGPDARKDPANRDHYQYECGYFYTTLTNYYGGRPPASFVLGLCKFVTDKKSDICQNPLRDQARRKISPANRFVKRRLACAYGWLDENIEAIKQGEFVEAYMLKDKGNQ